MNEVPEQRADIKWIKDGHKIFWDEDGPLLECPNHCPSITRKIEAITIEIQECIPGIEEMEVGFTVDNYAGDRKVLPWDENNGSIEGKFEIEWYYFAHWIEGLSHGDEFDSEFGWREVFASRQGPEVWDDSLGWS